jgi:2OG-Fe(II) oxygenase superfamily
VCFHTPPLIDLSKAFGGELDASCSTALYSSLSQWGWCHIAVKSSLLPFHFEKSKFESYFQSFKPDSEYGVIYRGRCTESGSAQPEPKQSLEVQRCGDSSTPLHDAMDVLHHIALSVSRQLGIPKNVLLHEAKCRGDCSYHRKGYKCNLDLMRVFLYDPCYPALGSSPHTDWGSWTVVWQDSLGGLQTYCSIHDAYVDVTSPTAETGALQSQSYVYFVLHVGDISSLAIGHILGHPDKFPSPRHRVICPRESKRVSLVYFAYPPPQRTLKEIEDDLQCVSLFKLNSVCHNPSILSYDAYFLLKNQNPGREVDDSESVYRRIREKSMDEVLTEKWKQVQREIDHTAI